jgi:large subunit ribosomal protein L13
MKTVFINNENAQRDWYVLDAEGVTLGRLATEVARRLRGKHKPEYTPNADNGDYIVVINAEKVKATGNKVRDKMYHSHSQYPGGIKSVSLGQLLETHPERVIQNAVKGMLPRGPLGYAQFRKLKVYAGAEHPHTAQQPKTLTL